MKTEISGNVVNVKISTRRERDSKKIDMNWSMDFENVSKEQLITLATRSAVIDFQRQFRDTPATEDKNWISRKLDVADLFVARERRALTEGEQLARLVKKMTPEAMIEQLKALGVKLPK